MGTSELVVSVWNKDPDSQGAEDVEEQDAPEDTANGARDIAAWILGFASGDCDGFNATVGARCVLE
jgi:hypothetical protein